MEGGKKGGMVVGGGEGMMSLPSSKFLSQKKRLFTNIKQMKSCQISVSFNIHVGLVPLKRRNMAQNDVGVSQVPSLPPTAHYPIFSKYNPINTRELRKS